MVVVVVVAVVVVVVLKTAAASVVSLTRLAALQVSVTCERGRATHVFDISMSSEEPEQHEVPPTRAHLVQSIFSIFMLTPPAG